MRKYYQRRLPSDPSKDYYYMLRNTPNNETIIVEYGFVDSTGDDVSQIKNDWEEMAEAVVRTLANYIGVTYTPPEGMQGNYYIVKKGDTLYGIAQNYGITVDALKAANNLSSNSLSIGMGLVIPEVTSSTPSASNIYVVKYGDTLYSIARMYGLTVDELKRLNNLTSNMLSIGQQLKVTNNATQTPTSTYIVKAGDSLYSIARMYGITVDALKRANNKASNLLSIGEVLVIPSNNLGSTLTHTIKAGDTLYSIAQMYGTTVNEIKNLNNLTSNVLTIGRVLNIPN